MSTPRVARPNVTVMIEPEGPRTTIPRDHAIKLVIKLGTAEPRHADPAHVLRVARKSLAGFPTGNGGSEHSVVALAASSRMARTRTAGGVVVAVEGSLVWHGMPGEEAIERCRATLYAEGYRVETLLKRECGDPACDAAVLLDWDERGDAPPGWQSLVICGRHHLRTCTVCKSTYMLTSTNFAGHAPSVSCHVCGILMVGWGGSKMWTAELLTKGRRPLGPGRMRRDRP